MVNSNVLDYKKFFPYGVKKNYKPFRLICFHHAGGSASIFRSWLKYSPLIDIVPIEIAGRATRMKEVCITDFNRLTEQTASAVASIYDRRPTYVYGHSLGGIIAFQTVYRLERTYGIHIDKLIVAGRHAPMNPDPVDYRSSMGIERLKDELLRVGATPKRVIDSPDFVKYILPMIFSDYKLHEDYSYGGEILDVPIVALSGTDDLDANVEHMKDWGKVTSKKFKQLEFKGTHFFPYGDSEKMVLKTILDEFKSDHNSNRMAV